MNHDSDAQLLAVSPWWKPNPGKHLVLCGGAALHGEYPISGAKNAVLPLMIASLLSPQPLTLKNVPASLDVAVLANLLQQLGVDLNWSDSDTGLSLQMHAAQVTPCHIDGALVSRMRASVLLLGALLARSGEARLPLPGGDAIGRRGIDFHLDGLRAMGAQIELQDGVIDARAPHGLRGAEIVLPQPSVGATENLLMAAVLADGHTVIGNAAREPEIVDLAACLTAMGANITGAGSDLLSVRCVRPVATATHTVMPDRIETGTIACAAAMTDGEIFLKHARADLLGAAAQVYAAAGVHLEERGGGLLARRAPGGLIGTELETGPYPGFATDLQAPTMAALAIARGESSITETIFEQRFKHAEELQKMGAAISIDGRTARIRGVDRLTGAQVVGSDVRASAALVLAGLVAQGETVLGGLDHLDRGYDRMAEKLVACGARITRQSS